MTSRVFFANAPFEKTELDIRDLFGKCGAVQGVRLILDRDTGRSRGFGFVEMQNPSQAERAIADLHKSEFDGRTIEVKIAEPRKK